jgi:hypothetical protein
MRHSHASRLGDASATLKVMGVPGQVPTLWQGISPGSLERIVADLPVGLRKILLSMIHGLHTPPRGQCCSTKNLQRSSFLQPCVTAKMSAAVGSHLRRLHHGVRLRSRSTVGLFEDTGSALKGGVKVCQ